MPEDRPVLRDGVIAGLIGATVVAVWFLIFDIARGRPLLTPALLGSAVFEGITDPSQVVVSIGPVFFYTLLHGVAFVGFGVVAASLILAAEREPALLIAFAILFIGFEAFFVGAAAALGTSMLGALVWWAILVGNLLASVAMLWYFFARHRRLPEMLIGTWGRVVREGAVAGLLGAVVVAVWFLLLDLAEGQPFHTPILLGTQLFGAAHPAAVVVILYTIAHGLAFIVFGVIAAALISGAEEQPLHVLGLAILFTAFEVFFIGAVVIAAKWVLDEVSGWALFLGNIFAATAMLWYFFAHHRTLATRLIGSWEDD
ncbi:MAG: hypothetical protein DME09_01100 [Candidatus Rokuibacteriota bacterium]|nr:MAG: hypothetical protein DME09_01100 [Candidatus Rokubacteria bacterium]